MKNKICLVTIFKDDSEYDVIERMLSTFMPYCSDLVSVLTGVSGKHDKLIKLIKKYNGTFKVTNPTSNPKIYSNLDGKVIFSNFAEARNVSFELAETIDCDWYMWADADDVLLGGENLDDIATLAKEQKMDSVFFNYWYSVKVKSDGTYSHKDVEIDQLRERLLRPKFFKWVSRLHEIALPKEDAYKPKVTEWKYDTKKKNNIVWVHLSDNERFQSNNTRNIQILNIQAEEEQWKDPRTIEYIAKTYYDMNTKEMDEKAIPLFEKYLELSGWEEERAINWEYLGKIYARQGKLQDAITCMHSAIQEFPNRHLNYLYLAEYYFRISRFDYADYWVNVALRMDKPQTSTTISNPLEIMYMACSIKANLAVKRLDLDDALEWLNKRKELAETEDDKIIDDIKDAKYFNQIGLAIFNLSRYLKEKGHLDKLKTLLDVIPPEFATEPFVHQIANEVIPPKKWGDKSIVYFASFTGPHFEQWDYRSLEKGIGGSETAVIALSEEWAKKGYEVTVFCDPPNGRSSISPAGVVYRPYWEMNWKDEFNTLILWRSPFLLDLDINAKKLFMDLHDIASNLDYTPERVKKLDKVFFKSKWHRSQVPNVPDDKALVISNGIYEI